MGPEATVTARRKSLRILLAAAGVAVALLLGLAFLAPRLVDVDPIKDRILVRLERHTGVRFSCDRAKISFFPRPRIVAAGVGMEVPGRLRGTIPALSADAELYPLLRGELRGGNIRLESPDFRVVLPAREKPETPLSLEEVEKRIASLLDGLRGRAPGATVTVNGGMLEVSGANGPIVSLRDLKVRIASSPDRMTAEIECASPYWDGLSIETEMRAEGLRTETRVEAAGFRPRELLERLAPGAAPWLGDAVVSLRGRIGAEGLRSMKGEFAGAAPILALRRGSRRLALRVKGVKGTVDLDGKSMRAVLSELVLQEPGVRISGGLAVDRLSPRYEASVAGKELAIAPVRRALLAIAGDVPAVRDILDVVRGGDIRGFSLRSAARSPGGLGDAESLELRGRLSGGSIHVPGAELDLADVRGEVSLAKGILAGEGIVARMGNARASRGSLRMGIAGDDPPFHAEFLADAEMGELHALLRRLAEGDDFRGELDRVRGIRGEASGRVVLGERLSDVGVRFDASKVRIAGTYDRVPFPIEVHEGQVSWDGRSVEVKGLRGTVGDSSFSNVSGSLEPGSDREGIGRVAASFDGGIGPETARWAYGLLEVPPSLAVKAPYSVSGSEISWERGGAVRAKAALAFPEGAALSFLADSRPGETTIDPLIVHGPGSDARMAARIGPEKVEAGFAGTLSGETVGKVLPIPPLPGHRIAGELEAVVDRANPARSTVRGALSGEGVKIHWKPLEPLSILRVSLTADGRTVRLFSSDLAWDNIPFTVAGTADFTGKELLADLDVSVGNLDAGILLKSFETATSSAPTDLPVRGALRLAADSIAFQRHTWRDVRAAAELGGGALRFSVTQADVCGIDTTGSFTVGEGEPSVTLFTSSAGEDIRETIDCLTDKKASITGEFRVDYRFEGKGSGDALLRSFEGPFEMKLANGRILEMTLLSRIFALLNVAETFRGRFPDFGKEGFPYRTLSIRANAKNGKFVLGEATLDAPSMRIFATGEVDIATRESDLNVLVAPFRTADAVVRRIPVFGYILGGRLVSIPVKVTGDIARPKISPLAPSAVGSVILGIAERALKFPVKMFSPFFPAAEERGAR